MLTPEQARQELQKVQVKDWGEKHAAAAAKLPKELRAVARSLLGLDAQGKEANSSQGPNQPNQDKAQQLDQMPAKDRLQILEALFPKIAVHVEAGWQLKKHLPYQQDFERKAFYLLFSSQDKQEGMNAFLEKRKAEFQGR